MNIPAQIRTAAQWLVEQYGDRIEHLGEYKGAQAYYYHFPDDVDAGFPVAYLLKEDKVTEITSFDALHLLRRFFKD